MRSLSRRDFLKLGGLGLLGASLPFHSTLSDTYLHQAALPQPDALQQGRVTSRLAWLYDQPSFGGKHTKMYWRDSVIDITGVVISQDAGDYNRIWYEVGEEGYTYSGAIQPVRTLLNAPTAQIPASGALGEVSVPFTDGHERPDPDSRANYRMYYATVHWILAAAKSPSDGKAWYQVLDDKWNRKYYVPGEHMRLIPDSELAPLSPEETWAYVAHRLKVAGRDEPLFDAQAVGLMYAFSKGVPRVINTIATGALLTGLGAGARLITPAIVEDVVSDLGLDRDNVTHKFLLGG